MGPRIEFGKSPVASSRLPCHFHLRTYPLNAIYTIFFQLSQLVDTTRRLETRIKFNQKLQWITVFVFLLLSIAIVYILKIEIHNNSSEYCLKPSRK